MATTYNERIPCLSTYYKNVIRSFYMLQNTYLKYKNLSIAEITNQLPTDVCSFRVCVKKFQLLKTADGQMISKFAFTSIIGIFVCD